MRKPSSIYRFFTAFIAFALIVGSVLPVSVLAHIKMSDFCDFDVTQEHKMPQMPDEHFDKKIPSAHNASQLQKQYPEQAENCVLTCCEIAEAPVQAEAVPATATAKVLLPVATLDFTVEPQPIQKQPEIPPPVLNVSPPPIFLVNSSFLN